jgi:hypothetical protein
LLPALPNPMSRLTIDGKQSFGKGHWRDCKQHESQKRQTWQSNSKSTHNYLNPQIKMDKHIVNKIRISRELEIKSGAILSLLDTRDYLFKINARSNSSKPQIREPIY